MELILVGDCCVRLPELPAHSVDAVITSPPYAEQRAGHYDGIPENKYPEWTVQWLEEVRRVLKPEGSVAIVIRAHVKDGCISDYVLRMRLAAREAGWFEPEELIWLKPDAPPLGHVARPRRAWENIIWLSPSRTPFCDPKANGRPSKRLGLGNSKKGFGNWLHQTEEGHTEGMARCKDYAEVSVSSAHRADFNTHPAQYPEDLAIWLIRLLTPPTGIVLDPFLGSGTTAVAARRLGRGYVGIEMEEAYAEIARRRLAEVGLGDLLEWSSPLSILGDYIVIK